MYYLLKRVKKKQVWPTYSGSSLAYIISIYTIYWLTAGGLGIWMIIDLFRIPGMVKDRNKAIIKEAIEEAKKLYPEVQ